MFVFLLQCLIEMQEHGGGIVWGAIESAFLAHERQHLSERQVRVPKKDRPETRLDSCLTGMQDRRLPKPWRPENRQQFLSRFNTADQRMQGGFMARTQKEKL